MSKEIILIKGLENETYTQFSERILSFGKSLLEDKEITQVKISCTLNPPPKLSVIPFKKAKIAAISIYSVNKESKKKLLNASGLDGGYLVDEAIPVAYKKTWNDGTATQGVCLLTLFRQRKGIDYKTFIHRWYNGHTPLSLKIHPLWNYNRNVVMEKLTNTSSEWDGIVEEHFKTTSDLLNPIKFFGNPLIMVYNMLRVYLDTNSFLDYKTIEPYFATEIWIKS